MKRIVMFLLVPVLLTGCKKTEFAEKGPTDVRIYNNTDKVFENVVVITSDDLAYTEVEYNYGTINPDTYTAYHRFDIAHPKADISLTIGGIIYSTPPTDFTYLQYLGQDRVTYEITIDNPATHTLKINVIVVEPIDDLR